LEAYSVFIIGDSSILSHKIDEYIWYIIPVFGASYIQIKYLVPLGPSALGIYELRADFIGTTRDYDLILLVVLQFREIDSLI
jgi:hypothetical protein